MHHDILRMEGLYQGSYEGGGQVNLKKVMQKSQTTHLVKKEQLIINYELSRC